MRSAAIRRIYATVSTFGLIPSPRVSFLGSLRMAAAASTAATAATADVSNSATNVLGTPLQCCCRDPLTGFYRDGFCHTGPHDSGRHVVCAKMTTAFLEYSKSKGNDLMTPAPHYGFPGLKEHDQWCLCALRWKEALDAGLAPPIVLASTHMHVLEADFGITMDDLLENAVDKETAEVLLKKRSESSHGGEEVVGDGDEEQKEQ